MANEPEKLTRHDLEAKIVKRCWEDDAFRKEFTADPAAAFVKYLNVQKASLPKIVVSEEAPGTWHIVLPAKPSNVAELSDSELEQVAGGIVFMTPALVSIIVTAAVSAGAITGGVGASAAVTPKKGW